MKTLPPVSKPTKSLTVGAPAPAFELVDVAGSVLRSAELLRKGHLLLTFYRGAWCSCCKADLAEVSRATAALTSRNVTVLAVFHELSREASSRIQAEYSLPFPLVDDPNARAAEAFGIGRSTQEMAAIEAEFGPELIVLKLGEPWIQPMQARYLIGRDGIIAHSDVLIDYRERSDVAKLLPMLDVLQSKALHQN